MPNQQQHQTPCGPAVSPVQAAAFAVRIQLVAITADGSRVELQAFEWPTTPSMSDAETDYNDLRPEHDMELSSASEQK